MMDLGMLSLAAVATVHRIEQSPKSGGETPAKRPNSKRDEFIFSEYEKGELSLKKILNAVNETPGWGRLGDETAIRKAYVRYCERINHTPLTRKG